MANALKVVAVHASRPGRRSVGGEPVGVGSRVSQAGWCAMTDAKHTPGPWFITPWRSSDAFGWDARKAEEAAAEGAT